MKNFNHTDAESLSQAAGILKEEQQNARIIAGGTDPVSYTHLPCVPADQGIWMLP